MKKNQTKQHLIIGMVCSLVLSLLSVSCSQDPIFYRISREIEPVEPRIKGVPTNFTVFEYESGKWGMYVASSSLYRYAKNEAGNPAWSKPSKPSGRMRALAATVKYLYALTDSGLYRLGKIGTTEDSWTKVSIAMGDGAAYSSLQSIYSAGDTLFVGGWNGTATEGINTTSFAIFYVTDTGSTGPVKPETALLSGAVKSGGDYYLSTNGAGIYYVTGIPGSPNSTGVGGGEIVGIINVGSDVVAAARNGDILIANTSSVTTAASTGQRMKGAIAICDVPGGKLLLLGIQPGNGSSSAAYGYREIVLPGGNLPASPALQKPGEGAPSSVNDEDRYDTTIGTHPVNYLYQAPFAIDPDMTLFAAIQGTGKAENETDSGVWSYRNNQWNAEE